jgi:preprotein translocase subunit Sec61beta
MIDLEDLVLHKVRLSILWLITVIDAVVGAVLSLMEPGVLQQFMETGEFNGTKIGSAYVLGLAAFFLILLIMAFLSVTLENKVNRWANIIVAAVALVANIPDLFRFLVPIKISTCVNIVVYLLIIWYAYKCPKRTE